MGVFGSDVGQFDGRFHQVRNAFAGEVRGISRSSALSDQDAQPGAPRACFFQTFHLAHADVGGELFALRDDALGIAGPGGSGVAGAAVLGAVEATLIVAGFVGLGRPLGLRGTARQQSG